MNEQLTAWVTRISEYDIPAFRSTVHSISSITEKDTTSAPELASVILQDPALAAKVLKFANSPYYNPSRSQSYTVSRAVIILGFEVVRELSLSLSIIESLLVTKNREVVSSLMAKSFHAATQARAIAEKQGEKEVEEIFVAALLHNLGEMAFWCVADKETQQELQETMEKKGCTAAEAQKKVLGFALSDLSRALVKKWNINKALERILDGDTSSAKYHCVNLGHQLAETIPGGWASKEAEKTYKRLASRLSISKAAARKMIKENAKKAASVAIDYGAHAVAKMIPGYQELLSQEKEEKAPLEPLAFPEPAPLLQLKVLRDLSSLLKSKPDFNLVIDVLLDGIHRGIGLDRALFALYVPLKSQVRAKYVVGVNAEGLLNAFVFKVGDATANPFTEVLLEKQTGIWLKGFESSAYSATVMRQITTILGTSAFFLSPILVNKRPIGLFYGDRQPSKRSLDKSAFESFEHFVHQATLAIDYVSRTVIK